MSGGASRLVDMDDQSERPEPPAEPDRSDGGADVTETSEPAEQLSALKAFHHQMRANPVIWVLFIGFALLTIPVQMLNPLRAPYPEADVYAAVIATLLVALAFDTRLDITWLIPARSAEQAQERNEVVAAITLFLLVIVAIGLLASLLLYGWKEGDDPMIGFISYLPIAAVAAELFMLMAAFYLRASAPPDDDRR